MKEFTANFDHIFSVWGIHCRSNCHHLASLPFAMEYIEKKPQVLVALMRGDYYEKKSLGFSIKQS